MGANVCLDPAVIALLPYPLPVPALSLKEALNIQVENITHAVKFKNTEQTITQPKETKVRSASHLGNFQG